jgi:hypothetical protein
MDLDCSGAFHVYSCTDTAKYPLLCIFFIGKEKKSIFLRKEHRIWDFTRSFLKIMILYSWLNASILDSAADK